MSPRSAPPTLYRIGLALRESPDVDHDALVHKLDGWAMDPRRLQARNRRELDVPGAWLEFCQRAQRDATGQDRPGSAAAAGRALVVSGRAVLEAQAQRRAAAAPSEGAAA